jgi:hypothetical protein
MDEQALEAFRSDLEFIRRAARQTEADFGRMGYALELSEYPSGFQGLCIELEAEIKVMCKYSDHRLEGLLYHIDVPEKVLHPMNACKNPEITAKVILQRELIKVVLKHLYSAKKEE